MQGKQLNYQTQKREDTREAIRGNQMQHRKPRQTRPSIKSLINPITKIKRSTTSYEPTWERFTKLPATLAQPYNNQYSTCYNARLSMFRERCLSSATNMIVSRIIELKENVPSTAVDMLSRSPNPYEAKIGGKHFLGSDGLNITDLRRFIAKKVVKGNADEVDDEGNIIEPSVEMEEMSSLEALETSLKLNHIAPTGPDSLPTFPFKDNDPFVVEQTPHVYFAGNCEEFGTKLIEHDGATTRLICIPSFEMTGQAVLMNLKSMECTTVEFGDVQPGSAMLDDEHKMET